MLPEGNVSINIIHKESHVLFQRLFSKLFYLANKTRMNTHIVSKRYRIRWHWMFVRSRYSQVLWHKSNMLVHGTTGELSFQSIHNNHLPYRDMQLIINYQSISRVQPKVYRWCSSRVTDKQCQCTSLPSRY